MILILTNRGDHVGAMMIKRVVVGCVAAAVIGLGLAVAGCGSGDDETSGPVIVVTTPVLGALVSDLAGDAAEVVVVMPNGVDPHDFQPSAKEIEALGDADLIVENGLGLESGLVDAIGNARDDGTPVFTATDHVALREGGAHADDGQEGEESHEGEGAHADGDDPHIWMDPITMRAAMAALAPVAERELGVEVSERAEALDARLEAVDAEVRDTLAVIPADRRRVVSGHESMGYFAERYDLEIVGVLVPSLSSQAQVSAANLAELRERIETEGVEVIFDEAGTPSGVADAIARETGARVVELGTHTLPDDGSYATFITGIADAIAQAQGAR
jgi:zinc/manganese transport system substrate-binding protein